MQSIACERRCGATSFPSVSLQMRKTPPGLNTRLNREVTDRTTDRYGRMTTITNTMIQTDAAINSGNSGGGMFNTLGQLQGIPARYANSTGSSMFSSGRTVDNIGFCIPINVAKPLITEVLRDYNGDSKQTASQADSQNGAPADSPLYGKPRLGVTISTITNAAQYNLPQGAFVRSVDAGSPAEIAGIQAGDIIVEVDGTVISSHSALTSKLNGYNEGDSVSIKVSRDEALASQAGESRIDMTDVGNGSYVDLTVELRVLDEMNY